MRPLSLTAMMLLISAQAAAADHYRVRAPSYACVDPRAALALNDPAWNHAERRAATRRQGGCLRVQRHQTWEQVSPPTGALRLLRRTPPHPGEPPLYFPSSAVEVSRLRHRAHGGRSHPAARAPATVTWSSSQVWTPAPTQEIPSYAVLPPMHAVVFQPAAKAARHTTPAPPAVRPESLLYWAAPLLLWALVIAMAALMVRLVLRWQRNRRQMSGPAFQIEMDPGEYRSLCVAGLRRAGWEASSRIAAELGGPDVIASHNGRRLAVQCHLSSAPLDREDVEDACLTRDWQGSDLAAIVSNAAFTEPARQLAARNGVVLLHEDQLASFAV